MLKVILLRQGLSIEPRLASNLWPSCLSLLSARWNWRCVVPCPVKISHSYGELFFLKIVSHLGIKSTTNRSIRSKHLLDFNFVCRSSIGQHIFWGLKLFLLSKCDELLCNKSVVESTILIPFNSQFCCLFLWMAKISNMWKLTSVFNDSLYSLLIITFKILFCFLYFLSVMQWKSQDALCL
jgi:hypothetical protein